MKSLTDLSDLEAKPVMEAVFASIRRTLAEHGIDADESQVRFHILALARGGGLTHMSEIPRDGVAPFLGAVALSAIAKTPEGADYLRRAAEKDPCLGSKMRSALEDIVEEAMNNGPVDITPKDLGHFYYN